MRIGSDFIRFGIVSVLGLLVDLSVAWSLATFAGAPLPLAAVAGFAAGAVVNYLLHEFWTFAAKDSGASAKRGGLYLLTLGVTLGARVGAVALLERFVFREPGQALPALVAATGLSFLVNYLLSKHLVFRRGSLPGTP